MTKRLYSSPIRDAAAAETRARVVAVAGQLMREQNAAQVSMEAVAKAAGVTRLTVYKQFGSRRGLLEAVFDDRALAGGLARLPEAMTMADPRAGLNRLIELFCDFWASDAAIGRLHDAAALDPEFALALAERNERRRRAIETLMARIDARPDSAAWRRDVTDLIFTLTSEAVFRSLRTGRAEAAAGAMIKAVCADILNRPR